VDLRPRVRPRTAVRFDPWSPHGAGGAAATRQHPAALRRLQARVAGADPATGERIILHETVATRRDAERALTRLLAEADASRSARTKASFGTLLDRWLAGHEVAITTRVTYESLIRNHIRPALGTVPLTKLHRGGLPRHLPDPWRSRPHEGVRQRPPPRPRPVPPRPLHRRTRPRPDAAKRAHAGGTSREGRRSLCARIQRVPRSTAAARARLVSADLSSL
jgi:hypothetical protein